MSIWAICSSFGAIALGAALAGAAPADLSAQLTQREALATAFPAAEIERHTAFLSEGDLDAVRSAAGADAPVDQAVVTYYVARRDGRPVGVAYFDSHRVRTLNEVLMIVVQPDDRIRAIEVLRFAEPPDYHPREPWLEQFEGRVLDADLSLQSGIANMTGATLTSHAITRAARRVLALHGRIRPFGSSGAAGTP
ncbi:MAG: FMN-binding protein [Gemmatimonadales bacterium]|nr:FMN-binding protein [Gemmatimonadales bacterium]